MNIQWLQRLFSRKQKTAVHRERVLCDYCKRDFAMTNEGGAWKHKCVTGAEIAEKMIEANTDRSVDVAISS